MGRSWSRARTSNTQRCDGTTGAGSNKYATILGTRYRLDGAGNVYALTGGGTTITKGPPAW
jgi:hypothetical protein